MPSSASFTKTISLTPYGIDPGKVHYQLPPEELHRITLEKNMGHEADSGALAIKTGEFTGRSPMDRFIVKDAVTEERIWWGSVNIPFEPEAFDKLYDKVTAYLGGKEVCGIATPVQILSTACPFVRLMNIRGQTFLSTICLSVQKLINWRILTRNGL